MRNTASDSKKLGASLEGSERKIIKFWKQEYNSTTSIWSIPMPYKLAMRLQYNFSIHDHTKLIIKHTRRKKLLESVLSDQLSSLKPSIIRYLPAQQWYRKTSTDSVRMQSNRKRWILKEINWQILKPLPNLHAANPVVEIKCNWGRLQRKWILRCPSNVLT